MLIRLQDGITLGGGSGTNDYAELDNKPQINGVTLEGDKSFADLGLANYGGTVELSSNTLVITSAENASGEGY